MNLRILLVLPILIFIITGCSNSRGTAFLSSEIPEATYIGKGTNAGPMLVGALGANGLTVGIAIDQGIAKDFHKQIEIYKAKHIKNISLLLQGYFPKAVSFSFSQLKFTAEKKRRRLSKYKLDYKNRRK